MQVTIEIPDDQINAALSAFEVPPERREFAAKAVCELSVKLFFDWLLNLRRFETISQATEYWVASTEDLLFPNDPPNPTKLYSRYTLSLPKARYLARLLLARQTKHWRIAAREELQANLNELEADARLAERDHPSQEFDLVLTRPAYEEFQVCYEQARAAPIDANRPIRPPKLISTFVQQVTIRVRCNVVVALLEHLRRPDGR